MIQRKQLFLLVEHQEHQQPLLQLSRAVKRASEKL